MIKIERDHPVPVLRMNDGKANVLNETSLDSIRAALAEVKGEKALVLAGTESCFSGGLDLKTLPTLPPEELSRVLTKFGEVVLLLLHHPRPIVAAVNGHAIAGGAILSMCCDTRIGADKPLKIGLTEVPIGMPLPRFVIRLAQQKLAARYLTQAVLHGGVYHGAKAIEVGYFDELAPPDQVEAVALERAAALAKLPDPAYSASKKVLLSHLREGLSQDELNFFGTAAAQQHAAQFSGSR